MSDDQLNKNNFEISLKISDSDFFEEYHSIVQAFLNDNRIDVDISMYYYDRFFEVCEKYGV